MNKAILLGRLTKDPEIRYTATGKVVAQFQLAVDRPFTNQSGVKEADFIPVIIWGKSAENVGNNIHKGQRVLVEGRIQTRTYLDKTQTKRYITEVIAERFEYIEKKSSQATAPDSAPQTSQPTYEVTPVTPSETAPKTDDWNNIGTTLPFDEEIPF